MKKSIISLLCLTMMLSLFIHVKPVEAINFEGQESKYIKLCSSSQLSQNESVCRQFNTYLKKKNQQLKSDINETKDKIKDTKVSMDSVAKQISDLNDDIARKESEISYLNASIKKYEQYITQKENEIKDRMYYMQSYSNSNNFINFIFGADSFSDFFSRIDSVNEITQYDEELIQEINKKKQELQQQKATVAAAKANIEAQKKQQVTLQKKYESLYNEQNSTLANQQQEQKDTNKAQGQLDAALSALVKETQSSSTGVKGDSKTGQLIAQKALSRQGYMYLWGGCHSMSQIKNPNTTRFDCSGLVCWAHYQAGVDIGVQYTGSLLGMGRSVTASQLQAGDIILFNNSSGRVSHVGIAINNSQMVHAPQTGSPVQVSNLTQGWRARVCSYRRLY